MILCFHSNMWGGTSRTRYCSLLFYYFIMHDEPASRVVDLKLALRENERASNDYFHRCDDNNIIIIAGLKEMS
jgi:hypothetical protein